MADVKTTLRVQITADLKDIKQGLGLLRGELANLKAQQAGAGASFFGGLRTALAGLGIAAVAVKLGQLADRSLEAADNMGKLAQKTGASVGFLSTLRTAVHGSEEDMANLEKALILLAKRQDDAASGNKDAAATFKRLGLSIAEVKSSSPEELFKKLVEKFGDMQSGAEKAALAQAVFGKSGADLIPVLNTLANGGLADAEKRSKALGTYLTEDMVAAAAAGKDAMGDLGLVAEGMANAFLSKVAPTVTQAMADIGGAISDKGSSSVEYLGQAVAGVIQTIESLFLSVGKIIGAVIADVANNASAIGDIFDAALQFDFKRAQERYRSALTQQANLTKELWADLKREGSKVFDAFAGNTPKAAIPVTGKATGTGGDPDANGKKAVKGIVDEAAVAKAAVDQLLKDLDQRFADNLISISAYYAQKRALQEKSIDLEIAQAQAEAKSATSSDAQSRALTRINQLQAERAAIGPALAREQAKAEEELSKKLKDVENELDELEGRSDKAVKERLERQFEQLRKQLEAEADVAGEAMLDKLINEKIADAHLATLERKVQETLSRLQTAETSVSSQVEAGLLPESTGEQQLQEIRARSLEQLRQLREAMLAYLATMDPASPQAQRAAEMLQQLEGDMAQVEAAQHQLRGQVQDEATQALTGFFDDLVTGAKSFKDAFLDMVRSFIQGLARMAAEALAKRFILSLFGAPSTAAPSLVGSAGGLLGVAGVHHLGGIIGQAQGIARNIDALSYGPPVRRYHVGGVVGLDEELAVLQKGEEVLTRQDPRHRLNGGGRGGERVIVKQPIVVFDEQALADTIAKSRSIEQAIVTHVGNNRGRLFGDGQG